MSTWKSTSSAQVSILTDDKRDVAILSFGHYGRLGIMVIWSLRSFGHSSHWQSETGLDRLIWPTASVALHTAAPRADRPRLRNAPIKPGLRLQMAGMTK